MRTLASFLATLASVLGLSFAAQADPTIDLLINGDDILWAGSGQVVTVDVPCDVL